MQHPLYKSSLIALLLLFGSLANAVSFPPQPNTGQGIYVVDEANLINASDTAKINTLAKQLYQTKKIPFVIITIHSLASHGATRNEASVYDQLLFSHMHYETDKGVLLFVIRDAQNIRIQFGKAYGARYLAASKHILDDDVIPVWNKNEISKAILIGAQKTAGLFN